MKVFTLASVVKGGVSRLIERKILRNEEKYAVNAHQKWCRSIDMSTLEVVIETLIGSITLRCLKIDERTLTLGLR